MSMDGVRRWVLSANFADATPEDNSSIESFDSVGQRTNQGMMEAAPAAAAAATVQRGRSRYSKMQEDARKARVARGEPPVEPDEVDEEEGGGETGGDGGGEVGGDGDEGGGGGSFTNVSPTDCRPKPASSPPPPPPPKIPLTSRDEGAVTAAAAPPLLAPVALMSSSRGGRRRRNAIGEKKVPL